MANKSLELTQTKGQFQAIGIVSGVDKDNFYKELTTKTGKSMRMVNFGLEIAPNKKIFISLNGLEKDYVYFGKKVSENGRNTTVTKKIEWVDRFDFAEDEYKLIGVHLGIKKEVNSDGKIVNNKEILTEYDSCKYINENLKDGMSVFVKGNIEYSNYEGKNYTKFIPTQISLCSREIDFENPEFQSKLEFEQTICFTGIQKNEDKTFNVLAKSIGYSSIVDIELTIKDSSLANIIKKELKPYNSIRVHGNIEVETEVETTQTSNAWGKENPLRKIVAPTKRVFVIEGADPETLDKEVYSETIIDEALAKIKDGKEAEKDFSNLVSKDKAPWGSSSSFDDDDDDDFWEE